MQLLIHTDGSLHCLYDEAIDLTQLGKLAIRRASHVEPCEGGRWFADLILVSGPILGPFNRRSEALEAERRWLEANMLCEDSCPANGLAAAGSTERRQIDDLSAPS